jgi:hypothetical protein
MIVHAAKARSLLRTDVRLAFESNRRRRYNLYRRSGRKVELRCNVGVGGERREYKVASVRTLCGHLDDTRADRPLVFANILTQIWPHGQIDVSDEWDCRQYVCAMS